MAAGCYFIRCQSAEPFDGHVLVYDHGGGTLDLSVLRIDGTNIEVVASEGLSRNAFQHDGARASDLLVTTFQETAHGPNERGRRSVPCGVETAILGCRFVLLMRALVETSARLGAVRATSTAALHSPTGAVLEIKDLKSFCMVAKLGGFSKASQVLAMGQPAITKQVKRLESELGQELIERGSRPIRLTAAGANLLRLALPLVEGVEDLSSRTTATADPPITVAVPHGFIGHVLLEAVRELRQISPATRIRIRSVTKDEAFELVQTGAADFAVAPDPGRSARFTFTPLFASERILITPKDHAFMRKPPLSLSEVAQFPLVLLRFQTKTRALLEGEFRRLGVPYEIAIELDSMDLLERYVELGLGLAVGLRGALPTERTLRVGIVSLSDFLPSDTVGVVQNRTIPLTESAAALVKTLKRLGRARIGDSARLGPTAAE